MPGGVPVLPHVPDEADFQTWKARQSTRTLVSSPTAPVPDEAEFAQWKAKQQAPALSGNINLADDETVPHAPIDPQRIHDEFKSGALAKRMAGANKRDAENLADEQASTPSIPSQLAERVATHGANLAEGIPGMEAAQAATAAAASHLPFMGGARNYTQSLKDIRDRTGALPAGVRIAERFAGAAPLAAVLPANPTAAGAILGGADQAFAADPNSLGERAFATGLGTLGGAALGRVTDHALTGLRALRATNPQTNLIARQAARAKAADALYGAAQSEGERNGATTAVKSFLQEPEIAQRIDALQSLEQYKNTPADSPEMIRALARSMSDEANTIEKGLAATDPSKPNILRDKAKSLGLLKKRLIDVVSSPSEKPPLHLDVAGETTNVEPQITPGREPMTGPIPGAGTTTVPFKYAGARDAFGSLHRDLSGVPDEALHSEWQRLAEMNQREDALHSAVQEAGYRGDYSELPRTEKFGHAGKEDLPDADGMVDPEVLAHDNKTVANFNRSAIVRQARQRAMDRIEREIATRPTLPEPEGEDAAFDFGANVKRLGPEGPAFQLRAQPDKMRPGVSITTPAMRVQTAPAEAEAAMMPSFRQASEDFAKRSGDVEAMRKGMYALQGESAQHRPSPNNIAAKNPKTREAFADWVQHGGVNHGPPSPSEIQAAREGIAGDLSNAWRYEPQGFLARPFRRTSVTAAKLLRAAPTRDQSLQELMQNIGLTGLSSPFASSTTTSSTEPPMP